MIKQGEGIIPHLVKINADSYHSIQIPPSSKSSSRSSFSTPSHDCLTFPVILTSMCSFISIFSSPPSIFIVTSLSIKSFLRRTLATAHEDVPDAKVKPAPLSQMRISTSFLLMILANCTFMRLGNIL